MKLLKKNIDLLQMKIGICSLKKLLLIKNFQSNKKYKEILENDFKQMYEYYKTLRNDIFIDYKDFDVKVPTNIGRLINNSKEMFKITGAQLF